MREQFLIGSIALPLVAKPDNPTPLPGEEEEVETAATATFVQQFPGSWTPAAMARFMQPSRTATSCRSSRPW